MTQNIPLAVGLVLIGSFCFALSAHLQHRAVDTHLGGNAHKEQMSFRSFLQAVRSTRWMLGLVRIDIADHIHFNDTLLVPWWLADPLTFVFGVALLFGLLHFARGLAKFQGALAKNLLVKPAA